MSQKVQTVPIFKFFSNVNVKVDFKVLAILSVLSFFPRGGGSKIQNFLVFPKKFQFFPKFKKVQILRGDGSRNLWTFSTF